MDQSVVNPREGNQVYLINTPHVSSLKIYLPNTEGNKYMNITQFQLRVDGVAGSQLASIIARMNLMERLNRLDIVTTLCQGLVEIFVRTQNIMKDTFPAMKPITMVSNFFHINCVNTALILNFL